MSEDKNEDPVGDDWAEAMNEQETEEAADWGDALKEQEETEGLESAGIKEFDKTPTENAENQEISDEQLKLDVILDVPVTVSMEIGRTRVNIRNLLQLNQGSVIELDRFAGDPMDVLVNGTLIAHGEVVVVNDKFGIRLTDVISPSERVKKLG